MTTRSMIAAALAVLAAAPAARAATDPLPPTVADLTGPRAASMGAYRGLAGGNDAIFLNAAALAARRRYSIETHWLLERAGSRNAGQFLNLSIVDSELGNLTGGFAYTRVASGPSVGNAYHLALASAIGGRVFGGITGKYLTLSGAEEVQAATADASLFMSLGRMLSVGVAGYNLIDVGHAQQAPLGVGAGVAIGDDRSFHLTADWRGDFDRRDELSSSYGAGAEVLVGGNFPVRAGFVRDVTRDVKWWSAGVGLVTTAGLALDLAYRQSVDDASDRMLGVALKMILLSQ